MINRIFKSIITDFDKQKIFIKLLDIFQLAYLPLIRISKLVNNLNCYEIKICIIITCAVITKICTNVIILFFTCYFVAFKWVNHVHILRRFFWKSLIRPTSLYETMGDILYCLPRVISRAVPIINIKNKSSLHDDEYYEPS